jgi:hypothetical protein
MTMLGTSPSLLDTRILLPDIEGCSGPHRLDRKRGEPSETPTGCKSPHLYDGAYHRFPTVRPSYRVQALASTTRSLHDGHTVSITPTSV